MFFWVFFLLFFSYSTTVVLVHEAEHLWLALFVFDNMSLSVQSRWQARRKEHRKALIRGFNHAYPCTVLLSDQGEVGIIKWHCVPSVMLLYLFAVPQVLKSCTEFIEKHGVVDGIYRLSGIASNIQKLRLETYPPYLFSVCGREYQVSTLLWWYILSKQIAFGVVTWTLLVYSNSFFNWCI